MDSILILALMAWVGYWMFAYVFRMGGIDLPEPAFAFRWAWIALPLAAIALLARHARFHRRGAYRVGDHVVYRMQKFSPHPGRRAEAVYACPHGDGYSYFVRKAWTVVDAFEDTVQVVTPGGKYHSLRADDPLLHRAGLIESLALRLRWNKSFPPARQMA